MFELQIVHLNVWCEMLLDKGESSQKDRLTNFGEHKRAIWA